MKHLAIGAVLLCAGAAAQAATIQRACLTSDRMATPGLCSCIQDAANRTLTQKDQKLAASFFDDPDKAQEIRMSKRRAHDAFWDRYRVFGDYAEALCS